MPPDNGTEHRQVGPGSGDYEVGYHWLHVPSNRTGRSTQKFQSRRHFLELLDLWNQDPRWKYWSAPR